jgi:putative ABC transport system permease protein
MVLRKMLSNRWMFLCLLIGSVLTVDLLSSIPIYTDGVLQRMLIKDLESYQEKSGVFPGSYLVKAELSYRFGEKDSKVAYNAFNDRISGQISRDIGLPVIAEAKHVSVGNFLVTPQSANDKGGTRYSKVDTISDFQNHITVTNGKLFSNEFKDGTYEAVVTQEAMKNLDLLLDNTYLFTYVKDKTYTFKVKIVGVFTAKDKRDPYWFQGLGAFNNSVIIDNRLYTGPFLQTNSPSVSNAAWFYAFDYHKINLGNVSTIVKAFDSHMEWYKKYSGIITPNLEAINIFKQYSEREKQLKSTLWVLQVPILIMLGFYIVMISKLVIDFDSNEIAVLKSRGASGFQIFSVYFLESFVLGLAALVLGPPLGLILCRMLGSANGFLEFVNRAALSVNLSQKAYLYSLIAMVLFMVAMLIPAIMSSRVSIVLFKQKRSRERKWTFWERYFIDVILLAVSCYGLYSYNRQQKVLFISGLKGTEMVIDPLLFIISTLFILGAGLVCLRIFPYIVRFIFWLGKKIWSPVFYVTFVQVGRTGKQEQFLMLFMILTLSVGIFSANAARTINRNSEEKIQYEIGSDIAVQGFWGYADLERRSPANPSRGGGDDTGGEDGMPAYTEPSFKPYTELKGVEAVTKVFKTEGVSVQLPNDSMRGVSLMGIIPHEFAKVAWFRPDLLSYHWYNYINFMTEVPGAMLVSKSFKDKYNVKEGDSITVNWGKQDFLEGVVYGIVDYWPNFNPNIRKAGAGSGPPYFIVANLNYIQNKLSVEPYEVWLKKKPNVSSNEVYKEMVDKDIEITYRKDASEEIIKKKNDPMLQGTNGALTLDFVVTIIISMIGFLIYWIMSIKKRVLQFGILRAMGLSLKKVIGMLVCEQVLLSGTSIFAGIAIGHYTSSLFVPLLQMAYSSAEQVPPFKVTALAADYVRLYMVVGVMLVIGFLVLGTLISRIKMDQALKLGED